MILKERIQTDFIEAFKAKDMVKKNFLGLLKGEIQNEEGRGTIATDEVVMVILKKMEKSLKQTNTAESLSELKYVEPYLPQLMSYDEIETIIQSYYNDKGLSTIGDMMKEFNANYKGKADNKDVSSIINKIIAGR
jgi:uncharacterized protein YqeY